MAARFTVLLLAAGESRRMGQPKLILPWGQTSVLGQVVASFAAGFPSACGSEEPELPGFEILVVTGGNRELVEAEVERLGSHSPVKAVHNPDFQAGGMISSIHCGLRSVIARGEQEPAAVLIGLGDQPQVQAETVRRVCAAFLETGKPLVVPSHDQRRGHPWLMARPLWEQFLSLPATLTPRQFLASFSEQIAHVPADASILQDLDTPQEYANQRP